MKPKVNKEFEDKKNKNDEEARWNIKRIVIFLSIVGVVLFFLYYIISARLTNVLGENDVKGSNSPQIELPDQTKIEDILEDAEESISNIDTDDIVSSQPQIQNAIDQLQRLTNQDNIKKSICSSICGE